MQKFDGSSVADVEGPAGTSSGAQLGASIPVKEHNEIAELVDSFLAAGCPIQTGENPQQ